MPSTLSFPEGKWPCTKHAWDQKPAWVEETCSALGECVV